MTKSKKIILVVALLVIVTAIYTDQSFELDNLEALRERANSEVETMPPKQFTTDGCSMWPNGFWGADYTGICIEHDIKYWRGGSAEERKNADIELKNKINERIYPMGTLMYYGVRIGGHPIMPAPWRWGYGFNYPHSYVK